MNDRPNFAYNASSVGKGPFDLRAEKAARNGSQLAQVSFAIGALYEVQPPILL
jgi:hypothetical protein